MAGQKPLSGKVVGAGVAAQTARRLANIARSDDVHKAVRDLVPPARRLGTAVFRAWQR